MLCVFLWLPQSQNPWPQQKCNTIVGIIPIMVTKCNSICDGQAHALQHSRQETFPPIMCLEDLKKSQDQS